MIRARLSGYRIHRIAKIVLSARLVQFVPMLGMRGVFLDEKYDALVRKKYSCACCKNSTNNLHTHLISASTANNVTNSKIAMVTVRAMLPSAKARVHPRMGR